MRMAVGMFAVIAALVALIVDLSITSGPNALAIRLFGTVTDQLLGYLAIAFCVLTVVYALLVLASDGIAAPAGFVLSALGAAALSGPLAAGPLVLAVVVIVWHAAALLRAVPEPPVPSAMPLKPARLRPLALDELSDTIEADAASALPEFYPSRLRGVAAARAA